MFWDGGIELTIGEICFSTNDASSNDPIIIAYCTIGIATAQINIRATQSPHPFVLPLAICNESHFVNCFRIQVSLYLMF